MTGKKASGSGYVVRFLLAGALVFGLGLLVPGAAQAAHHHGGGGSTWTGGGATCWFNCGGSWTSGGGDTTCYVNCGGDNHSGVPEPATLILMGSGLTGMALLRRRHEALRRKTELDGSED